MKTWKVETVDVGSLADYLTELSTTYEVFAILPSENEGMAHVHVVSHTPEHQGGRLHDFGGSSSTELRSS